MNRHFELCDVFGARPFTGNPLAVVLDADGMTDEQMAAMAREFGWSEITFVLEGETGQPPRVRIWTPTGELPFAGHPTVGTAVVLAANGRIALGEAMLQLDVGPVQVEIGKAGPDGGTATMTQREPEFGFTYGDRAGLAAALGLHEHDLSPGVPAQVVSTGLEHFLVPLRSIEALERAKPVEDLLQGVIGEIGPRWVYLFTVEVPGGRVSARSRLLGIRLEDAATGSAAGPLGAYLVSYGLSEPGTLVIEQGIEMGRPSSIQVEVRLEGDRIVPVKICGDVHIWARGDLNL